MLLAPGRAAGPHRQQHSAQAQSKLRTRHIARIAAPTTVADAQAAWAPVVPQQRMQPAVLPGTADSAEQEGTCQQQWSWKWGSSISYTQAGCPSDGRPALLLLHGFGVSHKHFVHNIEPLAEQYAVSNTDLGQHQNILVKATALMAGMLATLCWLERACWLLLHLQRV